MSQSRTLTTRPQALLTSQLDFLLIDSSISMKTNWHSTCAAIDTYLADLRAAHLNTHLIAATFDSTNQFLIQRDTLLRDAPDFNSQRLESAWGMTPLYDAISHLCWTLRDLNPEKCSIIIVTDGDDTSSSHTTVETARALLDWCRARGWTVTFFGCNFNPGSQAAALGAQPSNAIGVSRDKLNDAATVLARKRLALHNGSTSDIDFTRDEQTRFGGLLGGPST